MKGTTAKIALVAAALGFSFGAKGESAADVVAAQVRLQGHRCDRPARAARDVESSQPDMAAWRLKCRNAVYRVRLIPHRAAEIERVQQR